MDGAKMLSGSAIISFSQKSETIVLWPSCIYFYPLCVCWTVKYNRSFRVCYDLKDRDQNIMELIVDLDSLVKSATSIADDKLSLLYMYILTFERLLIIKGKR